MSEEILVNVTPDETRVAAIENGVLQEVVVERSRKRGLVGNMYLGRVARVLPGMGAAFLDVGLARTAFLHVSDIKLPQSSSEDQRVDTPIEDVLHEGQQLLVQVTKDPLGGKGARLTTFLSIPSRFLVFMPHSNKLGISQRIENEDERQRLRELMIEFHPTLCQNLTDAAGDNGAQTVDDADDQVPSGGYIVRTAAEGATSNEIASDIMFLQRLWASISERIADAACPSAIHEDLTLVLRTLRDLSSANTEKIRVDSKEMHAKILQFASQFIPELVPRIEHYPGQRPILDLYSTEDEIQRALQRNVDLKSGGHLVIDQTEAMTTIDVNTGGFVGNRNLEETIFTTNLEAAQAIARQLRLRNLGGIIIVDFIDMVGDEHPRLVLRALEKGFENDQSRITISEVTSLGLVQITRKRTRESLEHVLCEPCPTCNGRGSVKSAESVCYEILREILREARQFEAQTLLVVAAQAVVDILLEDESTSVVGLEKFISIPIRLQVESTYAQEQYDVVIL